MPDCTEYTDIYTHGGVHCATFSLNSRPHKAFSVSGTDGGDVLFAFASLRAPSYASQQREPFSTTHDRLCAYAGHAAYALVWLLHTLPSSLRVNIDKNHCSLFAVCNWRAFVRPEAVYLDI